MKQNIPENYYELLDVSPLASRQEIEEAFRRANALYDENSEAVYSLFTAQERELLLSKLAEAYEILRDPVKRKAYDRGLREYPERFNHEAPEVDVSELIADASFHKKMQLGASSYGENETSLRAPLEVENTSKTAILEQYRILFTNMDHARNKGRLKIFAITSAIKGEGKSVTSLNLAYVAATQFKKKTILLECDLRKKSTLSGMLEGEDLGGMVNVLNGDIDLAKAIRKVQDEDLWLLTSGETSNCNVPEFLNSGSLKALLDRLKSEFDYVIMDCPPIVDLVDMKIISKIVDGIIIVVRAGLAPKDIVAKAVHTLDGTNVIGLVLNDAEVSHSKYTY